MPQVIEYGDFTFPFTTLKVSETFSYDVDNRTVVGTEYQISVTGWVAGPTDQALKTNMKAMREALKEPRERFRVRSGGDLDVTRTFFDFNFAGSAGHDWGPRPQSLQFHTFSAMRSAKYVWGVVVLVKECADVDDLTLPEPKVVNLTRSHSFSVDATGLTTRVVGGTLTCLRETVPADQFRHIVVPKIPLGFKRIQQQFSQSPDQRVLTFSVADQEVVHTFPTPMTEAEATWSVRIADFGARVFYNLQGRMRAPKNVNKSLIFTALSNLISSRFPLSDPSLIFEDIQISDSVYDNEIAFDITASGVAASTPSGDPDFTTVFTSMLVHPPDSTGQSYPVRPYGEVVNEGSRAGVQDGWSACNPPAPPDYTLPDPTYPAVANGAPGYGTEPSDPTDDPGEFNPVKTDVSFIHNNTPVVALNERISWEADYGRVAFESKNAGTSPVVQQTHRPVVHIIQAGYFTIWAESALDLPDPPSPILASGVQFQKFIQTHTPEPVQSGGKNSYTVHWRYVLRSPFPLDGLTPTDVFFPVDIRRLTPDVDEYLEL